MISSELKCTILKALCLTDWTLEEHTTASEVPGWDSLSHISVILAVESDFNVHFSNLEVLRLKSVGDLQQLLNSKLQAPV